jgi:DNA polymerase I-like protein with 3'-5' exonuclease and polymerase domains
MATKLLKRKTPLMKRISIKRSFRRRITGDARPVRDPRTLVSLKGEIEAAGFHITGNDVDPKIIWVVDPIITDYNFNKNPKGALGKQQKQYIGRQLDGSIPFEECAFITCAPPVDKFTYDRDKAIGDHLKTHREVFANICKKLQPRLIVAMGKLGARQVYGRAVQITKIRGLPENNQAWGLPVMPTLGIGHVQRYPENLPLFTADMDTIKRIRENRYKLIYKEKIKVDYKWVDDLSHWIKNRPKELVVDIEGVGLDPFDKKSWVLTVQLCREEGKAECVDIRDLTTARSKKLVAQLKTLLEHPKVKCIGHNLKFDFKMLREKLGITIANYEWDTMVMAHIIDENMLNFNLADLTRRFVPDMAGYSDEFDRDPIHVGKTRMDLVPPDKLLQYGGGDVDATWRLYQVLRSKIDSDDYFPNYYARVHRPALRAFCDIERYGFTIDKKALKDFEIYLREEQAKAYKNIVKMVPKEVQKDCEQIEKYRDENNKIQERVLPLNITRQKFLVAMCFTHPKGLKLKPVVFTPSTAKDPDPKKRIPSTSTKEHFPYFEGNKFIDAITTYIKNAKLLGTYVGSDDAEDGTLTGFYKYIKGNAIRPVYSTTMTDTGRTGSRDPNGQNFPKRGDAAKRYRKMFVAPPGWVLVDADLSQIELRGAAYLANERTMIDYFRKGVDLHAATAARVIGKSIKQFLAMDKDFVGLQRFRAKAVNFGFLYGMWWRKFMSYAKTQYGVDYTEREAEAVRQAFFDLYPDLEDWHRNVGEIITRDGGIRSPLGRMRHLPSVYSNDESVAKAAIRKGINAPNQSFASDLGLIAIGMLHEAGIDIEKFRIIGFVHDDIITMARVEYAVLAARTLRKYMQNVPLKEWFDVDFPVPIVAEAAIGYNLSDMVEVNEFLSNPKVKTLADIQDLIQDKLDKIPDTAENEKKRKGLQKEIEALNDPKADKNALPRRKLRVKLNRKRSKTIHASAQAETQVQVRRKRLTLSRGKKAA